MTGAIPSHQQVEEPAGPPLGGWQKAQEQHKVCVGNRGEGASEGAVHTEVEVMLSTTNSHRQHWPTCSDILVSAMGLRLHLDLAECP